MILKTEDRTNVKFLMDFDYNNVLTRLKYVLGSNVSLFADILVKGREVVWKTNDDAEFLPLILAPTELAKSVKEELNVRVGLAKKKIENDTLLGTAAETIIQYPSDDFIFYCKDDVSKIIITAWGCEIKGYEHGSVSDSYQETHNDFISSEVEIGKTCPDFKEIPSTTEHEQQNKAPNAVTPLANETGKSATGWLIATYIFAFLGGWLGIVLGITVYRNKEYKQDHRRLGLIGAILAIVSMIIWNVALVN